MNITLHQLRVLMAIESNGSITAAAHALHITQPAVSNILKQLELAYDHPLTETIGKKIYLTEVGKRVSKTAHEINTLLEKTTIDINALHNKISGTMTVTIVSTAKYFVPKLLGEFRKIYPEINIKLTVCNRQESIEILKKNSSDFLIMSQLPDDVSIEKELFYQDSLVIAAAPESGIKHGVKSLKDLKDCDWIIREKGSGTRIVMEKLLKKYKMIPKVKMEVGNNESIKQMIMANMGISIISKQSIELELKNNLITTIPVNNFPLPHPWYLVRNKGKHPSEIVKEFFKFAKGYDGKLAGILFQT